MRVRLIPLDGGPPLELHKDMIVIGRSEDCDFRFDHKSVSKRHCVLVKTDGVVLLRDLGSTNGTRVNGHKVRRATLLPNDQLSVAIFKFTLSISNFELSALETATIQPDSQPQPPPENHRAE